jgi:hypothetical protein
MKLRGFMIVVLLAASIPFWFSNYAFSAIPEVVVDANDVVKVTGDCKIVEDEAASIGKAIEIAGVANNLPVANPSSYVELEFYADAGVEYYIWVRGKSASASNDSSWIQFDGEIGTDELGVNKTEGCGGFGNWLDGLPANQYDWSSKTPVEPPVTVTFQAGGKHKMRIQPRQVVHWIDQIWLSTTQKTRPTDPAPVQKSAFQVEPRGDLLSTFWGGIKAGR